MNPIRNLTRLTLTALVLCVAFATSAYAQSAKIEGQVTSSDQKPVADINVALQGTQFGAASNAIGKYSIEKIPAGDYKLVVSGVGYTNQRKSISIESGEQLTVNITLSKAKK